MKILHKGRDGFGLYTLRSKDKSGYTCYNETGGLWMIPYSNALGVFKHSVKLNQLKEEYPELFLW